MARERTPINESTKTLAEYESMSTEEFDALDDLEYEKYKALAEAAKAEEEKEKQILDENFQDATLVDPLVQSWSCKKPYSARAGGELKLSEGIDFINDPSAGALTDDMKVVAAQVMENVEAEIKMKAPRLIAESASTIGDVATFVDMIPQIVRHSLGRTDLMEILGVQQMKNPEDFIYIEKTVMNGKGESGAGEYYDDDGNPTIFGITIDGDDTLFNAIKYKKKSVTATRIYDTEAAPNDLGFVLWKERTYNGKIALLVKVDHASAKLPPIMTDITVGTTDAELLSKVEGSVAKCTLFMNYNEEHARGEMAKLDEFNEMGLTFTRKLIQAKDRVLSFRYDLNMLTDIIRQFGVAGKKRVMDMIVYEYSISANKRAFNLLVTSAKTTTTWVYSSAGGTYALPENKLAELERYILKEKLIINNRNNTGEANKLITSSSIAAHLMSTPGWKGSGRMATGIYRAGSWKGLDVYVNTTLPSTYNFVYLCTKVPGNPFKAPAFLGTYVPLFIAKANMEDNPINEHLLFVERNCYYAMPDDPTNFGTFFEVNLSGSAYA